MDTYQSTNRSENESIDDEESGASISEYNIGHSTVTFILDKEHNRRIAWTGYNWDHVKFVEDIQLLMDE